jgi:hypothetical protein
MPENRVEWYVANAIFGWEDLYEYLQQDAVDIDMEMVDQYAEWVDYWMSALSGMLDIEKELANAKAERGEGRAEEDNGELAKVDGAGGDADPH